MWFKKKAEPVKEVIEAPLHKYDTCERCKNYHLLEKCCVEFPGHIWPDNYLCAECIWQATQYQAWLKIINSPAYKATIIDSGTMVSKLLGAR